MIRDIRISKNGILSLLLTGFLSFYLIGGCSGGDGNISGDADNGAGTQNQSRLVTGTVNEVAAVNEDTNIYKNNSTSFFVLDYISSASAHAGGNGGDFLVAATARDGSVYEVYTDPVTGEFVMDLSVGECYTMSFAAHHEQGMNEFLGFMVFECGPEHMGELDDQLCLSEGDGPVSLGTITVHSDNRFSMPMHNPLGETDFDSDGMTDFHDPDYVCGNVEDNNHDGYYDDDMDHDGFHDDDMDFDGFHDSDGDHDGFHDHDHMGGGIS